jgi:pimeloyl-ACP methyl ester carboxylesterase
MTHSTAPTEFAEANGIRFAYRRFGSGTGTPLVFLQHFRGGMDHWDPLVTDGLAQSRPVILFDNTGVSGSSGETPSSVDAMATDAAAFLGALGLDAVDLLGFSLGGCVAQALAARPNSPVRRLILAGTAPRGGEPARDPKIPKVAGNPTPVEDDYLFMFFAPSETSQAAGRAFYARRTARSDDPPSSMQTLKAQSGAFIGWWRAKDESFAELKRIAQPALVVNGMHDAMIPTDNSYALAKNLPDAQLILYPDAGHGAIFQYPELFVQHAALFLDA